MRLKRITLTVLAILFILLFYSCGNTQHENNVQELQEAISVEGESYDERTAKMATRDMHVASPQSRREQTQQDLNIDFVTSKATIPTFDGDKKFIRTSHLRFSVLNAVKATHVIEDIVIAKEGFVIKSELSNSITREVDVRVSRDSVLQRSFNHLNGNLILRVKHELLNETLREIALVADQIHYRNIEADDITFQIRANELEQSRKKDKAFRIKSISGAGKGHKLDDLLTAEDNIDDARLQADNALVEEEIMYDKVKYSTITISLWQEPTIADKVIVRPIEIEEYRVSFFENVTNATVDGWQGLLAVVEFFVLIWPITLLVVVGVVFIVRAKRAKKVSQD